MSAFLPLSPRKVYIYRERLATLLATYPQFEIIYKVERFSITNAGMGYRHDFDTPDAFFPASIVTSLGTFSVQIRTDAWGRVVAIMNSSTPVRFRQQDGMTFHLYQPSHSSGRGEGAMVTVDVFSVDSVQILNGGSGFTTPPIVRVYARPGSPEPHPSVQFNATVSSQGTITDMSVSPTSSNRLRDFPLVEIERQSSVFTVPTQRLWTVTITPPQTPIVVSLAHLPLTYKSTGDRLQYRLLAPGDSFRLDLAGMQFISGTNSGMSPDTLIDITILEYNITTVSDNDLNIPSLRGFPIAT